MKEDAQEIITSIPPSESDRYLFEWGYNLLDDYISMVKSAEFKSGNSVFEFATGTGRMTALLTRLNFNVITGNLSFEQITDAEKRITHKYMHKVKFIRLDLENLPFADNTLGNITFVNTMHHLNDPINCIKELIRVHSENGKLLLADFNNEGFDIMDKLHKIRYGNIHPRGFSVWNDIKDLLKKNYAKVEEVNTQLNSGIIAQNKI